MECSPFRRRPVVRVVLLLFGALLSVGVLSAQEQDAAARHREVLRRILNEGLMHPEAFDMLAELTARAGHRLSGSPGAATAVELAARMMRAKGLQRVRLENVMVPRWERGPVERASILMHDGRPRRLAICALGGSIATPPGGITAEVVEVRSFDELKQLGTSTRGKIIFFNRPMDPTLLNTFEAYGRAVNQRSRGAVEAARAGGVAALVRSMTLALDDVPHTGGMGYADDLPKLPGAAVSTRGANLLSELLKKRKHVRLNLELSCNTYPDAPSHNVLGEITGTERPDEVIVVGGHLDNWDKGQGAHDDGAGCVQAIEALNLLRKAGVRPRRTIRAVLFMNEENGLRGGKAYAADEARRGERHVAMIESDRGGFVPRGVTTDSDTSVLGKLLRWQPLFESFGAGRLAAGPSGVDISPMVAKGVPGFGLDVETHRYFDYHHSDNDTLDKVNPRELELGAIVEALLCYLISEEGL
ncbi:MAG: M20/M25/M40 family metallo-hydrolase [Bacteroidota bacterium]